MKKKKTYCIVDSKYLFIVYFQALIDAHDQIGAIWLDRGSGIDEKATEKDKNSETTDNTDKGLDLDLNGDMPVETIKVVGLRKVPGQPLGLTVSCEACYNFLIAF